MGVRAVSPPPQHVACPQSRNDYPHPTPPLQLYAESWCTARCTSWVYKCTMCSLGLQGHAGRGRIGAVRACAAAQAKGANLPFKCTCACEFSKVVPLDHHSSGTMRYFTKNAGPSPYEGSFSAFRHIPLSTT